MRTTSTGIAFENVSHLIMGDVPVEYHALIESVMRLEMNEVDDGLKVLYDTPIISLDWVQSAYKANRCGLCHGNFKDEPMFVEHHIRSDAVRKHGCKMLYCTECLVRWLHKTPTCPGCHDSAQVIRSALHMSNVYSRHEFVRMPSPTPPPLTVDSTVMVVQGEFHSTPFVEPYRSPEPPPWEPYRNFGFSPTTPSKPWDHRYIKREITPRRPQGDPIKTWRKKVRRERAKCYSYGTNFANDQGWYEWNEDDEE